jgi:hypothetical protein
VLCLSMQSTDADDKPKLTREEVDQLADDIAEAAAHIDAATHRLLANIRRFDACGGWDSCRSSMRHCGMVASASPRSAP